MNNNPEKPTIMIKNITIIIIINKIIHKILLKKNIKLNQ